MKKIIFAGIFLLLFTSFLSGCINKEVTPNGKIIYYHVLTVTDETNMQEVIGFSDYVFIGTVEGINKKTIRNDAPAEYYSVRVEENLKGSLITDSDIEVIKMGGYLKNGTLILYKSDSVVGTGLCTVGEKYIFVGYGQQDGSLLLDCLCGNTEYTDELKESYLYDFENQIDFERERFACKYDPAYEK